jgi:hypothetical protein
MRRFDIRLISLLVLPLLPVGAPTLEAREFCIDNPFRCDEGHAAITEQALPFLSPALLDHIVDKNTDQDFGAASAQPELHFTNCLFAETSFYIQDQYRNVRRALTSDPIPDTRTATMRWGQLLHPVQDFYSHSAWADPEPVGLGFGTTHPRFLLDAGLSNWRSIHPYKPLFRGRFSDVVPVQGNHPDGTVRLPRDVEGEPTSAVPEVRTSGNSTKLRGLMTAVAEPLHRRQQQCPPADGVSDCLDRTTTCIRHGGTECRPGPTNPPRPIWASCFNHDSGGRPHHDTAFALAKAQTRHEWCRLLHMLRDQHGLDTASIPISLWVKPTGNMHPPGTKCAQTDSATASVTVGFTGHITGSATQLVSSFVAFTTNFRSSARSTDIRDKTVSGSVRVCIDPEESPTIATSLWAYDDLLAGVPGMSPMAPVRRGVSIILRGPDYPAGWLNDSSDEVQLAVRISRDQVPAPQCG